MDYILNFLNDPWKIWGVLGPLLASFTTWLVNRHLTRYRERVSRLSYDLAVVRNLCKQACIAASELKPCLYKEEGESLEPSDELHELLEFPTFQDRKLMSKLREFIKLVDEQRNIFSWGSGAARGSVSYSAGGQAYYYFSPCNGKHASRLPNLSEKERENLLRVKASELREVFKKVDGRIGKLLR